MRNIDLYKTDKIKKMLSNLSYDYVFIDTAPAIDFPTLNAIEASDLVIAPVHLDLFSAQGVINVINTVQNCNRHAEIIVVPNMMVHNSKLHKTTLEDLKDYLGKKGIKVSEPLPSSVAMSDTIAEKKSIIEVRKLNKLSLALKKLHKEII